MTTSATTPDNSQAGEVILEARGLKKYFPVTRGIVLSRVTGHVKALIGGRDYAQSKFDRARQAQRQAGSSFKPFVYTAAISSGIPASRVLVDGPVVLPQLTGHDWRPANFGQEFQGPMTLREGLYRSINMIAIKLGWEEVGIETVAQTARRMGIQTEIERFPSTTIGAAEVIPLEIAEAYSVFPNMGTKVHPFPILRVEDAAGNSLWEPQPERTQGSLSWPADEPRWFPSHHKPVAEYLRGSRH